MISLNNPPRTDLLRGSSIASGLTPWMLLAILFCAVMVRLLFNASVGFETPPSDLFSDQAEYDAVGISIASGLGISLNGMPYVFHPPGYPLLLGAIYAVCGHSYASVRIVQSLLGAFTCVLVFLIGERLFSRQVACLATAVAVVYPFLVFYTALLLSETLFVFLSTLFLYLLARLRGNPSARTACLAGVVLAMMNLTRPVTLLLPLVLPAWAWLEFRDKKQAAKVAVLIGLVMSVTMLPWTIRNYIVTHAVIPVAANDWAALYGANNRSILKDPDAIGGWVNPEPMEREAYRSAYLSFFREYLFEEPWELLRLEAHKLKRFWTVFPKTRMTGKVISAFSYGLLLPFFLWGTLLSFKSQYKPWLLGWWIAYFCFMALVAYGSTRFRLPVEPAIILFAAVALQKIWAKLIGRAEFRSGFAEVGG